MSPSTRWHSSVPRETFSPLISNAGKSESIWWGTIFPSSTGCSQRGPFLSCSIQSTELWTEWWRQEEAEGAADRILRGHYTQTDPTNHITDSMKKPANTSLEIFSLWIPSMPSACHKSLSVHSPAASSFSSGLRWVEVGGKINKQVYLLHNSLKISTFAAKWPNSTPKK